MELMPNGFCPVSLFVASRDLARLLFDFKTTFSDRV